MDAGKSLLAIIDDILDFTKIESGMMHIVPNDYKVNEEIRELYNIVTFRNTEVKKMISIELNLV